jgi:competence protein ComEA
MASSLFRFGFPLATKEERVANRTQIARTVFLIILGAIVLFIVYSILKRPESSAPPLVITLQPRSIPAATVPPTSIEVYVTGAINKPDVYALPIGAIVKDLIAAAGGATVDADLEAINLAQRLTDQAHIHVPHKGEVIATPTAGGAVPGAVININTADATQLDTLPGIGPSTAQGIIEFRTSNGPFKKIEDIKNVPRIGDALFEKIKSMITVGP